MLARRALPLLQIASVFNDDHHADWIAVADLWTRNFLSYTLHQASYFLDPSIVRLSWRPSSDISIIQARVPDFDAVVIAMNFSVALMYIASFLESRLFDRLFPSGSRPCGPHSRCWNAQAFKAILERLSRRADRNFNSHPGHVVFSITENHLATIWNFLTITGNVDVARERLPVQPRRQP